MTSDLTLIIVSNNVSFYREMLQSNLTTEQRHRFDVRCMREHIHHPHLH